MTRPRAVLTDIEGTTTPIAFVRDVLFPQARARLPRLIARAAEHQEVAAAVASLRALAPGRDPAGLAAELMDQDSKLPPLKALQGIAWRDGYTDGSLVGRLYPDVAPALRRWHGAGVALAVFSSGSIEAQRLLFGHSVAGDLTGLFSGFHDTSGGAKSDPDSYRAICLGAAQGWLFLSDMEPELDAAAVAGMATMQLVRAEDGTVPSDRHPTAAGFDAVEASWSA